MAKKENPAPKSKGTSVRSLVILGAIFLFLLFGLVASCVGRSESYQEPEVKAQPSVNHVVAKYANSAPTAEVNASSDEQVISEASAMLLSAIVPLTGIFIMVGIMMLFMRTIGGSK